MMVSAATRPKNPAININPPKNSAQIARKAKGAGIPNCSVKNFIEPLKPYPPNQPSINCSP